MKKIIDFLKKYWIAILIVLAVLLYVVNVLIKGPTATPSATSLPKAATFRNLTPGVSNEADVASILGRPVRTSTQNGQTVSEYKSTNIYRTHTVLFTNGITHLIKEVVNSIDNKEVPNIISSFGKPQFTLYPSSPNSAYNLYVYPGIGLAYMGHPDGTLLEIWYFQATTIDDFKTTWGQDYRDQPTTESGF